jgi:hypothetical protein
MKFDPAVPVAVFLGPSLDHAAARALLPANYYPPVRMGDVYRLVTSGVGLIVIIDGVFHGTTPVWQREIVAAMQNGITVVGASSMGALRAVELESFGMLGHGTIVDWYRTGRIEGDDEVALLHAEAEHGYRAMSEPLVNIRWNLDRAVAAGALSASQAADLLAEGLAVDHTARSYPALMDSAAFRRLDAATQDAVRPYFGAQAENLKAADAVSALRWCAEHLPRLLAAPAPPPPPGRRIDRFDEQLLRGVPAADLNLVVLREVLSRAAADRPRTAAIVNHAARRYYLLEWARQAGVAPPADVVPRYEQDWIARHQVTDRAAWLRANAITAGELARELAERATADWLLQKGPAAFGLDRPFLEAWALLAGIEPPPDRAGSEAFRSWLVEKTPYYFGVDQWSADVAFARELQVNGEIAALAQTLPPIPDPRSLIPEESPNVGAGAV